jgi:hypothetical protein
MFYPKIKSNFEQNIQLKLIMKFSFLKRWRFWRRFLIWSIVTPILLFFTLVIVLFLKQDQIVQELITDLNKDFVGEIEIEDSHISPFEAFPYISIDLDHVKIYEDKENHKEPIVDVEDIYVGFNTWDLIAGKFDIQLIEIKDGYTHAIQHKDGELNISKALTSQKEVENLEEEFHIHLKKIKLINVDIYKLNEENGLMVESFIDDANLSFQTTEKSVHVQIESKMEMNIINDGDTSFFRHKHLKTHLDIDYFKTINQVVINPSQIELEHATFQSKGKIDVTDDCNVNISLFGEKKNFDLFIAFAPEELTETLERYNNAGEIYFDAKIAGKTINGHVPAIKAKFGCKNAYFDNKTNHKKLDNLSFRGYFSNASGKDLSKMEFALEDFNATPEAGNFNAKIHVVNFESPEIDMTLDSDFDLNFLAQFINQTTFNNLKGKVQMHMKFHDIIDLSNPEKSIEKLNQAYYSELNISGLSFSTPNYHLPLNNLDTKIEFEGHEAKIKYLRAKLGKSDIDISGHISDLPAILHHTNDEVVADLIIKSKLIDIKELTNLKKKGNKPIDEKIDDLNLKFKFVSSAKSFTESPNLPVGEFFIEDLYAKLEHFPHTFHDFHADFYIEDSNFRIIDFSGMIDKSDFHFNGKLLDYHRWLEANPKGDTEIEFDLTSKQLALHDLFSYAGENYVPEDYRREVLSNMKLHGDLMLHFNNGLKSIDLDLDHVGAKMKVHPMAFQNFNGRVHYEDNHLMVEQMSGKIGKSDFKFDLNYYLGDNDAVRKRDNHFALISKRLDFDELFNYNSSNADLAHTPTEHEQVFNIYDLPFTNMTIDLNIDHLNYHRYLIHNLKGKLRTTPSHYLYIDTLSMNAAGGKILIGGYFNGSNRNKIYFKPKMKLIGVDLDKLLFKFENFGQDHLVSENLHGKITTTITGKLHMHPDLIPIMDDSEVHMDVMILNGRLVNYETFLILEPYFGNKNLHDVRFDTLRNNFNFVNGTITIPKMTINSSLAYMQISGMQDMDYNMEYYIKVPLKLIGQTAWKTIFGKDEEEVNKDEIEYLDPNSKTHFVNIKLEGNVDDYKVSLGKDKRKKK